MAASGPTRSDPVSSRSWGWLARLLVALMLALGTLASASPRELEGDPLEERGEESEWLAPRSASMARTQPPPSDDAPEAIGAPPRPPVSLRPGKTARRRPDWQRPRRVPPDDDDEAIA